MDEERIAAIENGLALLTEAALIIAGGLYAKGVVGDGAWNELFAAIEGSGQAGEEAWHRSRALRSRLAAAGR